MSSGRKVSNLLGLAVLATVLERPMHRYEMASVMRARGKDRDMNIKWGSLYTVVQNLERHGFVEPTQVTRQGARPERTVYRITEAGRQELREWTRELIADVEEEQTRFTAALSVLAALPPDEVTALLRTRLDRLTQAITKQRTVFDENRNEIPRLFLIEDEYRIALLDAEAAWIRSVLDELTAGTFPDLSSWRTWHHSGDAPAEFAELARRGAIPDT